MHNIGEWLSLVEHLVRDQGVGGSNPLSPTNISLLRSDPNTISTTTLLTTLLVGSGRSSISLPIVAKGNRIVGLRRFRRGSFTPIVAFFSTIPQTFA